MDGIFNLSSFTSFADKSLAQHQMTFERVCECLQTVEDKQKRQAMINMTTIHYWCSLMVYPHNYGMKGAIRSMSWGAQWYIRLCGYLRGGIHCTCIFCFPYLIAYVTFTLPLLNTVSINLITLQHHLIHSCLICVCSCLFSACTVSVWFGTLSQAQVSGFTSFAFIFLPISVFKLNSSIFIFHQ